MVHLIRGPFSLETASPVYHFIQFPAASFSTADAGSKRIRIATMEAGDQGIHNAKTGVRTCLH